MPSAPVVAWRACVQSAARSAFPAGQVRFPRGWPGWPAGCISSPAGRRRQDEEAGDDDARLRQSTIGARVRLGAPPLLSVPGSAALTSGRRRPGPEPPVQPRPRPGGSVPVTRHAKSSWESRRPAVRGRRRRANGEGTRAGRSGTNAPRPPARRAALADCRRRRHVVAALARA